MRSSALFCLLAGSLSAATILPEPQAVFSNLADDTIFRIPTVEESAVQARRVLHLTKIGTLSTVFPSDSSPSARENRPHGLGGVPIGLMDYFADCEPATGNPTILALDIATSFKNVAAGSNITLSLRWHPPSGTFWSAAALPRFSLIGHLEEISSDDESKAGLKGCFATHHPDSVTWFPGNRIHTSRWVRLVVDQVYWIGGFGDRAYIGWIPVETWKNVTEKDVDSIRLPGEKKGWGEWLGGWSLEL